MSVTWHTFEKYHQSSHTTDKTAWSRKGDLYIPEWLETDCYGTSSGRMNKTFDKVTPSIKPFSLSLSKYIHAKIIHLKYIICCTYVSQMFCNTSTNVYTCTFMTFKNAILINESCLFLKYAPCNLFVCIIKIEIAQLKKYFVNFHSYIMF